MITQARGNGIILIGISLSVGVLFTTAIITSMVKQANKDDAAIAKANCIGVYDTIPCHQMKINHLLKK